MIKPDEDSTLFVYGSLRDPNRRRQIIGHPVETLTATICDYELRRARYYFIRKRRGINTAGFLLLNLTRADLQLLDLYEETPRLYTREKVEVLDEVTNRLRCWTYLPTALTLAGQR